MMSMFPPSGTIKPPLPGPEPPLMPTNPADPPDPLDPPEFPCLTPGEVAHAAASAAPKRHKPSARAPPARLDCGVNIRLCYYGSLARVYLGGGTETGP